jgi:hypothetical protein
MTAPEPKQFILPFSTLQDVNKESFSQDDELAAVFVLSEMEREKGAGLIGNQNPEELVSVAKVGYPVWVFPSVKTVYLFDGLNVNYSNFSIWDFSLDVLVADLEKNQNLNESHLSFLLRAAYFLVQNRKQRRILLPNLIANKDFHSEFTQYQKEAKENINQTQITQLQKEETIPTTAKQITDLQTFLKNQADTIQKSREKIFQLTKAFSEELDFGAGAVKDESSAKIRAQEEQIKPKVAKLLKTQKSQLALFEKNVKKQLAALKKQKAKFKRAQLVTQKKVNRFKRAKAKAERKHLKSERQWKEKLGLAQSQLEDAESRLRRVEKAIWDLDEYKTVETGRFKLQVEGEVGKLRQPVRDLEVAYSVKLAGYNQKKLKLEELTKAVVGQLDEAAKLVESDQANFEALGLSNDGSWQESLFYVPFYVAYYQSGAAKRLEVFSPSTVGSNDFSSKLKVAFGRPKIKELLNPRFKSISELRGTLLGLMGKNGVNPEFEALLLKNNLLQSGNNRESAQRGLLHLNQTGWLSEKEYVFFKEKMF